MKRILITGGAGFVGSHLAKTLSKNNTIYVIDNYFTGNKNNHVDGVNYINSETSKIFLLYKDIPLDYIYHLGEYSRVEQSYEDIELVMRYNTSPFYQVLKLAKHHNAKLIYSGSSTKFSKNIVLSFSSKSSAKSTASSISKLLALLANCFISKVSIISSLTLSFK